MEQHTFIISLDYTSQEIDEMCLSNKKMKIAAIEICVKNTTEPRLRTFFFAGRSWLEKNPRVCRERVWIKIGILLREREMTTACVICYEPWNLSGIACGENMTAMWWEQKAGDVWGCLWQIQIGDCSCWRCGFHREFGHLDP